MDNDEAFIRVKESYDRIDFLDKDSNGQLFLSVEYLANLKEKENKKAEHMVSLKKKILQQKERDAEVLRRQEEAEWKRQQEEKERIGKLGIINSLYR